MQRRVAAVRRIVVLALRPAAVGIHRDLINTPYVGADGEKWRLATEPSNWYGGVRFLL